MAQYSRKTVLAATDLLENAGHARITRFLLEHGLEGHIPGGSMRDRASGIARYLLEDPERVNEDGENLTDAVVNELVMDAVGRHVRYGEFDYETFSRSNGPLNRALARDGFNVEGGELRRTLPAQIDLPQADDEVHALLAQFGFDTPTGHLNQAIAAHARGDWAAANAQLRACVEALFDSVAQLLANRLGMGIPPAGYQSRVWLAQLNPPFLSVALNEWTGQGTGFLEGFFRRLHPQGAHPGLSDEDDSTFRLHLVLLTSRSLLRRLAERIR